MKRLILYIILAALVLVLSACSSPPEVLLLYTPAPSIAVSSSPSPAVSVSQAQTATPEPEPEPSHVPPFEGYIETDDSTVVVADSGGLVYFGYSDGNWLTHSQASAYCGNKMKLCKISLSGADKYVTSSGIAENRDSNWDESSWVKNGKYELTDCNSSYILKLKSEPKSMLCRITPERVPKANQIKDTSSLLPALQALADKQFGSGNVTVQINSAVSVDIDGDGETETVVNASNNEYDRYETFEISGYWYSIACAIEQDGSFAFIEERYENGFREESGFVDVESILDIDGDGVCEFIINCEDWEYWGIYACRLENGKLNAVAGYYWSV